MSSSTVVPMSRFAGRINIYDRRSHCQAKTMATAARASSCSESSGKDYYKVLSLEHSAAVGAEEIKRAYRRLALRYHPDVCPPSRRAESTERFLELRRAYETLSDPARRVRYDADLGTATGGAEEEAAARARVEFARDVWEAQLCALRARSERRRRRPPGGLIGARVLCTMS